MFAYELTYTDKWKSVLADKSQVKFLEGPSQVSKTTLAIVNLIYEAMKSPKGETLLFLLGESTNTLYRNFIVPDVGITKLFPNCVYVGGGSSGGQRVEVEVWYGEVREIKSIYFLGYSNKGSETKVLGSKPYFIMADEFNKAHDEMVRAVMTRITSVGTKFMATSNGDSPDILMYDYLNACRPHDRFKYDVPMTTMQDMEEQQPKDSWTYWYFGLDDRPNATQEWIERMYSMHPEGSFEFNSKVLGIRASTDGILFGHLMNKRHDVNIEDINFSAIKNVYIGVDVGSGGETGRDTQAKTVFAMIGYSKGYQRAIVLDGYISKKIDHTDTTDEMNTFLYEWFKVFAWRIRAIHIDDAEPALISTMDKKVAYNTIDVKRSVKRNKLVTSKSRVAIKEQMLHKERLLFAKTEGAQMIKKQLAKVKGLNGVVIDEDMLHNDVNDSCDYAITPIFQEIMKAG